MKKLLQIFNIFSILEENKILKLELESKQMIINQYKEKEEKQEKQINDLKYCIEKQEYLDRNRKEYYLRQIELMQMKLDARLV